MTLFVAQTDLWPNGMAILMSSIIVISYRARKCMLCTLWVALGSRPAWRVTRMTRIASIEYCRRCLRSH
ncbi:hypothetical protein ASPBRDRAFT_601637 [Aspergillus brasiliensis CBS 101740]|uniref:Uncharacterized protein n=1 Tax=Aspergillus brasiliensis (strain CBS 101740 / IMI 381727 / IBT 21946) TaxID=767769 RepID=A0A1L9UHA2_ASPBC|nr:hypothetical protein ASPBRDRAFT_601637 [Aspergillus brasiliensis CBS 101740]